MFALSRYGQTACIICLLNIEHFTLCTMHNISEGLNQQSNNLTAGRTTPCIANELEKENAINFTEPENEKPSYSLTNCEL